MTLKSAVRVVVFGTLTLILLYGIWVLAVWLYPTLAHRL